jgi:uncharacterized membrane protein
MVKRNKHSQKKKSWQYGTAGIVPVFVPVIGGIVFLVFFIFFLIAVFQSAGVPALLGTGSFCLLGLVLLLTMNQKITYTPEEFTYRDMLRISHTYSYSQIKKIQAGKNVTIHVGHRIILIDQMASNGNQFAKIAKMHAPDAEFRTAGQAKLFGGNVHNPGEFVFIFILIGLIPVVLVLFALHMGKVISPKDLRQETCEIASYDVNAIAEVGRNDWNCICRNIQPLSTLGKFNPIPRHLHNWNRGSQKIQLSPCPIFRKRRKTATL